MMAISSTIVSAILLFYIYYRGLNMLKRLWSIIEIIGTLLGFLLLMGPPSWQGASRGITIVLFAVLILAGGIGAILLIIVVQSRRQPSYFD